MLIDSHSHLDSDKYDQDLDQVIQRARENGVQQIVTIGTDIPSSQKATSLSETYSEIYASVGIHPHEVKTLDRKAFMKCHDLADTPKVIAIGETGLDYYYQYSPPEQQIRWFREHIRLARSLQLPLVIHSRDAKEETLLILEEEKADEVGGVLHCFTGDADMAKRGMEMGFYISFSGIVTFPKAKDIQQVARDISLERILVETDCPYLTPVPFRGKRNEPAHTRLVATKIAELRGMSLEETALALTENTRKLFKLNG